MQSGLDKLRLAVTMGMQQNPGLFPIIKVPASKQLLQALEVFHFTGKFHPKKIMTFLLSL